MSIGSFLEEAVQSFLNSFGGFVIIKYKEPLHLRPPSLQSPLCHQSFPGMYHIGANVLSMICEGRSLLLVVIS